MVEQHQRVSDEGAAWIRRFPAPATNGMPLLCFPHAGGAASYFHPLSLAMAPDVQVLAVQYPGRQERHMEPCVGSIADLADGIAGALPGQVRDPYAFFGQSMGGVLAFEVARRLQAQAAGPQWLFASACRAPSRFRGGGIHLLDDAGLVAELRRLNGTDDSLLDGGEELLAMILPVVRADYQAIETYSCAQGPPLTCPVTALVGDADELTVGDDVAAWSEHSTGAFDLRVFPGGHFFLDRAVEGVAEVVLGALAAWRRQRSAGRSGE